MINHYEIVSFVYRDEVQPRSGADAYSLTLKNPRDQILVTARQTPDPQLGLVSPEIFHDLRDRNTAFTLHRNGDVFVESLRTYTTSSIPGTYWMRKDLFDKMQKDYTTHNHLHLQHPLVLN